MPKSDKNKASRSSAEPSAASSNPLARRLIAAAVGLLLIASVGLWWKMEHNEPLRLPHSTAPVTQPATPAPAPTVAATPPASFVDEWELGFEWQFNPQMELTAQLAFTDRTNTVARTSGVSYDQFEGTLLRVQFQMNY